MLHFVYGGLQSSELHMVSLAKAAGFLEYERARVRWFLSIDVDDVPVAERAKGRRTWRALVADGADIEFSDGFTDLHTRIYEEILAGRGYGVEANRAAIETVAGLRGVAPVAGGDRVHPFARGPEQC
jgi:UDP-N-acetyl-2-amino-2-deoxyglucuronate dehydrogenase